MRRTFPDLDKSLIRVSRDVYRSDLATYNESKHIWRFVNNSIIDFGYMDSDSAVYQYQSAEYDVIRFDELTHFTEFMYVYMLSRLRGANPYPKQIKSTTNPGNIGHNWVRERFIDLAPPDTTIQTEHGTRRFIPSLVQDNKFLMASDPEYIRRLEALPEKERKALLYGDWDIFEGQYFAEFRRDIHTCDPFIIPPEWKRYRGMDYGLDMAACVWAAFDPHGNCYVYREYARPDRVISDAARDILDLTAEPIAVTFAPFDMWGRSRESGQTQAELFSKSGLIMSEVRQAREAGWLSIHEWLKVIDDGTGPKARLTIFNTCTKLIKHLPQLQHDQKNPTDCATEPHDITHLPDALRYLLAGRPTPAKVKPAPKPKPYNPLDDKPRRFDNFNF